MDKVKVVEKWIDGSELKLWEIVDYWRGVENRSRRGSATPTAVTGVLCRLSTCTVYFHPFGACCVCRLISQALVATQFKQNSLPL